MDCHSFEAIAPWTRNGHCVVETIEAFIVPQFSFNIGYELESIKQKFNEWIKGFYDQW